jgi:hypothetical protein
MRPFLGLSLVSRSLSKNKTHTSLLNNTLANSYNKTRIYSSTIFSEADSIEQSSCTKVRVMETHLTAQQGYNRHLKAVWKEALSEVDQQKRMLRDLKKKSDETMSQQEGIWKKMIHDIKSNYESELCRK